MASAAIAVLLPHHTEGFYLRFGFRTVDIVPDGYAEGLHRYEMRLRLPDRDESGRLRAEGP